MTRLLAAATALGDHIHVLKRQGRLGWGTGVDLETLHVQEDKLFRQFVRGVASGQLKGREAKEVARVLSRLSALKDSDGYDWHAYA